MLNKQHHHPGTPPFIHRCCHDPAQPATWLCPAPCRLASACVRRGSQRCCRPPGSWTSAPPSPSWRSPQQGTRKGMWRPVVPLTPPSPPPTCLVAPGGPGTCSPMDQVRPHGSVRVRSSRPASFQGVYTTANTDSVLWLLSENLLISSLSGSDR